MLNVFSSNLLREIFNKMVIMLMIVYLSEWKKLKKKKMIIKQKDQIEIYSNNFQLEMILISVLLIRNLM